MYVFYSAGRDVSINPATGGDRSGFRMRFGRNPSEYTDSLDKAES